MNKNILNLFPARVSIGTVQQDGTVLMSPEFMRAMSALFVRVGGPSGMSSDDLALMQPVDQGAAIGMLASQVAALQQQVAQFAGAHAELIKLRQSLIGVEQLAGHRDPYRVNWERPGRIGFFTPATGAFTSLTATTINKLTLTPPAKGATFTLADGKTFTVTNSVALAGADGATLTVNNTLGFTATDGAFLDIGNGGVLKSAAYQPASAFAARTSAALAPAATDAASTQALANSMRAALISVGIGS